MLKQTRMRRSGSVSASPFLRKTIPLSSVRKAIGYRQFTVKTGKMIQTTTLPSPVVVHFLVSPDTAVTDTLAGLPWAPDTNNMMGWNQEKKHIPLLKLGDFSDGRKPTRAELRSLDSIDATWPLNDCCVWSAVAKYDNKAWYCNLCRHFEDAAYIHHNYCRALAVCTAGR